MTKKTNKIFIDELYSKAPQKNYATNETDLYQIDDIWSLELLDSKDYGPEINRILRYILVVIDNTKKFRWTVPLKNKKLK